MSSCECPNRWQCRMDLCFGDAARSRAPDGVELCGTHAGRYEDRLKSLKCPTALCPHLVMTAATSDESRADSPRLGRIPDSTLNASCMLCYLNGQDETLGPVRTDRHGVLTSGSHAIYEGNPEEAALPLPAHISSILLSADDLILEVPLSSELYLLGAVPIYCARGETAQDDAYVYLFAAYHNIILPSNARHCGDSTRGRLKTRASI